MRHCISSAASDVEKRQGPGREVTLTLPAATTATITPGRYVYDVQVVDGARTTTYGAGTGTGTNDGAVLIVQGDVTR